VTEEFDESEFTLGTAPELVDAVTATEVEAGHRGQRTFESRSPDWWPGGRTFGGMVVAQALNAAMQTVPLELEVHSLHGYFLRPSTPGALSTHRVDDVRDGRSFNTREVTSEIEGKPVFRMMCQFHTPEAGDEYQLPMAQGIGPPDEAEAPDEEGLFPFEMRELGATRRREDGTYVSTRRVWFRTSKTLPDDPIVHACLLAYLSDMTGASFRPLSLGTWGTHTDASLDHAVWFHRPWRADVWSLYDLQALVNAGGRATLRGVMHGQEGTLHLSMAQELLIRELDEPIVFRPRILQRTGSASAGEGEVSNDGDA
jgi:acyl-CoA thioesterase-2